MVEIVVEVEGRPKTLKLRSGKEKELRSEFSKMCAKDPVLKSRLKTHYATFKSHHPKFGMDVEIDPSSIITDGTVVKVFFASYAPIEIPPAPMQPRASSSCDLIDRDDDELSIIGKLGVHSNVKLTPSTPTASTVQPPTQVLCNIGNKTKSNTVQETDDSDGDNDDVYFTNAMRAKADSLQKIQDLNFAKIPQLKKKKSKQSNQKESSDANKENRRIMPSRAVKLRKINEAQSGTPLEPLSSDREDSPTSSPRSSEQQGPSGPSHIGRVDRVTKSSSVNRRKPQKRRRLIGETITEMTVLPQFPKDLNDSILKGLVYVDQTHTKKMNDFLKAHIKAVTKDAYPTRNENKILKSQVINRLKIMKAPNIDTFKFKMIASLSASLRNYRNYTQNKIPKKQAEKAQKPTSEIQEMDTERSDEPEELDPESADFLLRMPVVNKETVIKALDSSSQIRSQFMSNNNVRDCREIYPYLMDIDLLLHDYAIRVPSTLQHIEENFDKAIKPLASMLNQNVPKDDLEKLKLIQSFDDYFRQEDNHFPCLQLWDELNRGAAPLNSIPKGQAPAIVVVVNDKELISVVLVFDGECLYTIKEPTAFKCIALLLAAYFVYIIAYPKPYEKLLYSLQHFLHGEVHVNEAVKGFFTKYNRAKNLIQENDNH